MRGKRFLVCMILVASATWVVTCEKGEGGTVNKYNLPLRGTASGGSLVLASARLANQKHVSLQTVRGESAESVARRLADMINKTDPFGWNMGLVEVDRTLVSASGESVRGLLAGVYTLAGTEKGLGIPQPPLSLSCAYEKSGDKVVLRWINGPGEYDYIFVNCFWNDFDHANTVRVAGTSTTLTIDRKKKPLNVNDMAFHVIGVRDKVPSNAASVRVSQNGNCQSETYGIPFTAGIAPNWRAWSTAPAIGASALEQGERYPELRGYNRAAVLSTKPYYQKIRAPAGGTVHGVWRKFIGLTSGHTYRLTAHLSTLEMDSVKGDWSLSVCAAPNGADGKDPTVQQLAGLAALPDGSKGPKAGRIFHYGPGSTTRGIWEVALTGHKPFLKPVVPHITLPQGADTMTVWIRFSCSDPNGEIAFSGVKLEDVTAAGETLPTAEEVIKQEREERHRLLDREAWIKKRAVRRQ